MTLDTPSTKAASKGSTQLQAGRYWEWGEGWLMQV